MDDALVVRGRKGIGDLAGDREGLADVEPSRLDTVRKCWSLYELEHQGRRAQSSRVRVDHATLLAAAPGSADRAAQRDACRKVLAQVYRVVAAVLGPRSPDVADVAQEAFMRVHRNIHAFTYDEAKPAGPTAWINKIALRAALDHRAALPPWEADGGIAESTPDGDDDVGESLELSPIPEAATVPVQ